MPIIPWIGGKRRLAEKLIPQFPVHSCYAEVFAGRANLAKTTAERTPDYAVLGPKTKYN
jgi:site-specific DNA-adenine methylase